MKNSRNNWLVAFVLVAVVALNLIGMTKINSAYSSYHWQNYAAAYPLPGNPLSLVGQSGGIAYTVAVQGQYAYLGIGPRLVIMDISDPSHPVQVGQSRPLPGIVYDVAVSGNFAYLADNDSGLRILNIANPSAPYEIGSLISPNTISNNLAIAGGYIYLAQSNKGVQIINVTNPANPVEAGYLPSLQAANSIEISQNKAYVVGPYNSGFSIFDITTPTAAIKLGQLPYESFDSLAIAGNKILAATYYGMAIIDITNPALPVKTATLYTALQITGVRVAGSYAYLTNGYSCSVNSCRSEGSGVSVVNITDPTHPVEVNFALLNGNPREIIIQNNYAYVAAGAGGLAVLDITNQGNLARLNNLWRAQASALSGSFVYTADSDSGLRIVDVSQPNNPVGKAVLPLQGSPTGVALSGTTAYVSSGDAGLRIIDVSVSTAPVEIGAYDTPGFANGVTIVGTTAYVADNSSLIVLNVANKSAPQLLGTFPISGSVSGVAIVNTTAYVAAGYSGLKIINVANPASMSLLGAYTAGSAESISVSNNRAYVAGGYSGGFQILDVSNPAAPALLNEKLTVGSGNNLFFSGNTVYLADGFGGLGIYNVSDPLNIQLVSTTSSVNPVSVIVSNTTAYLANDADGISLWNVSSPAAPTLISAIGDKNLGSKYATVVGNYAYIASGVNGLKIFDVTNPAMPILKGRYDTPGVAARVVVRNNLAYVADYNGGLRVLDVSNPAAPAELGSLVADGLTQGIFVGSGNYAFMADGYSGLRIVNIAAAAAPVQAGVIATGGYAYSVYVVGNTAYVADGTSGLVIVDITNTLNPAIIKSVSVPGTAMDVVVSGNYAYVAAADGGVRVINIATPAQAAEVSSFSLSEANGIYIANGYAYVSKRTYTGQNDGLAILNISNPLQLSEVGFSRLSGARSVFVSAGMAYVTSGSFGLDIVNVSQPSGPYTAGTYQTNGKAYNLSISGNYAYIAENESGLSVMDISNPAAPKLSGHLSLPGKTANVALGSSSLAFVAGQEAGLTLVNVNAPAQPSSLGQIDSTPTAVTVIAGNRAFLGGAGFHIIDITNPTSPVLIGSLNTVYSPDNLWLRDLSVTGISLSGNYAFITHYGADSGLYVLDITDQAHPTRVGYLPIAAPCDVSVVGGLAYVASLTDNLVIIDIATPTAPALVSTLAAPGAGTAVKISGNYAYLADGILGGVRVIDITNPAAPVEASYFDTAASTYDMLQSGNYLYTADRDGGLVVLWNKVNPDPVPALVSSDKTEVVVGDPTLQLKLSGSNFVWDSRASWNGVELSTTFVSPTELIALVPAGLVNTVGTYPVTVVNPAPGGGTTNPLTITVKPIATGSANLTPSQPGEMVTSDGSLTMTFPAGAVSNPTVITYTQLPEPPQPTGSYQFAGVTFQITAVTDLGNPVTTFSKPVEIVLHFTDQDVAGLNPADLGVYYWNTTSSAWVLIPSIVDMANHTITITLNHLTQFALLTTPQTPAVTLGSIDGSVVLQGRPAGSSPSKVTALNVQLTPDGQTQVKYNLTQNTDQDGKLTLSGLAPGKYSVRIKNTHTLANILTVDIKSGSNTIPLGTLVEGDANNDNVVSILDFSALAASFSKSSGAPGYNPSADFDQDGTVSMLDFSRLATNFGQTGAGGATPSAYANSVKPGALFTFDPAQIQVSKGQAFTLTVKIDTSRQLDGAYASLQFDPAKLKVNSITSGNALNLVLLNQIDNQIGKVDYASGTLNDFPANPIVLLEIQAEALTDLRGNPFNFVLAGADKSEITSSGQSILSLPFNLFLPQLTR
jgi:hypothetical protein